MKNKHLNHSPNSESKKSHYLQARGTFGYKKTEASNGVGLQMTTLLLFTNRHSRVRASAIAAIAHFHGGSRPFDDREVIYRYSQESWFVKVVCTLFVRSQYCLDSCVGYLSKNLTPLIASEVIKRLDNPNLGLKFLELSRVNLCLNHSLETYNLLLRSLCEMGLHSRAKEVLDYMRSDGHFPSGAMVEFLVFSFTKLGNFDVLMGLLSQLQSQGVALNTLTYNRLLNVLVKQNKVNEAFFIFKEHFRLDSRPDNWTFNILIRGLCRIGEVKKAVEFFYDMRSFGCSPDTVTYNTLINGFCRVNEVDRGHDLLKEVKLRNKFSPNVLTYTSVISGYSRLGRMEDASSIYDEMIASGVEPSAVTFNVLIDGFGKVGDMFSAESMRERMLSLGYLPDVVTFTSLIDGYCRNGQLNMGLKLWGEMNRRNISPNVYTFAILINALCKENRLIEARRFLSQLKQSDIVPKPFMYNPVIDGFCKAGNVDEANTIMAEMEEKRCKPDKVTFTILIIGHCMKGRMFEAISIFNKMLTVGCAPDSITVNSLISCLLKAGMPNEAYCIKQSASEHPKLLFASLKKATPLKASADIPVAA